MTYFSRNHISLAVLAAFVTAVPAQVTVDFSSVTGRGIETSKVLLENIRVSAPLVTPFGTSTSTATYNVTWRFDPVSLHLIPEVISSTDPVASNCATATISVFNAVIGSSAAGGAIAGATVTIGNQTATTNSSGIATFSALPAGSATVGVAAANYVAASQVVTLTCGATPNAVTMALSPSTGTSALAAGKFRVILTWGANPEDLDSHMTGPNSGSVSDSNRWHVYYGAQTNGDMCGLDTDDTTSFGPETVTCPKTTDSTTTLRNGVYRYSIHHYYGSSNIGGSGASVRLEIGTSGNPTVYNYTPPTASYVGYNDVWTVFELTVNNGNISVAPVNTVTHAITDVNVRSSSSAVNPQPIYGQSEDLHLFSK